ncbi:cupin [Mycolicibacterium frederiksbergense]|uniref:cupin n=1 Tax=Mycolicibacterium frederiksbergense TaxID=117567 RepID=UPI00265C0C3D|nr:cupin [Mycolicibacterium frederiksbergense]MDO0974780.1 cupin [Mycolicibacterium frederiksbergense]
MTAIRSLALAAVACAALVAAPAASATPSVGVEAQVLSQSTSDGQDFITKELTIAPGGSTGWHWHPGQVYGVIRAGTLTHYGADCDIDGVYPTGGAITEQSGPGYVHLGRNLGPDPLVMWVGYIDPAGSAQANPVPNPGCPFE